MKKLLLFLFFLLPTLSYSQSDCMGTESYTVNPLPTGGGYAPGTVVTYCVTYNNWNTSLGTNWFEGFDITLGIGWDATTIIPVTYPNNLNGGFSGSIGQWVWIGGTFNQNGNNFGPGFFFDINSNGQSNDDWGDEGNGPWTMCFSITVGNTPGESLMIGVSAVSDGFAGSWTIQGCDGFYPTNLSPGIIVLGCLSVPSITPINIINASCNGYTDGSFDINNSGGTSPYIFTINGIPATMPATNISAGDYEVISIDNNGCSSLPLNITISENSPVENTVTNQINILCFGQSTGSFDINSMGGVLPYTYNLNSVINNTGIFNNLLAGLYTVNISDGNGCNNSQNVILLESDQIITNIVSTDVNCNGESTGELTVSTISISPYTYELLGISNQDGNFDNLLAGLYTVNISDGNGCLASQVVVINESFPILYEFSTTNIDCFGNNNGSIQIDASGGTPIYTFSTTISNQDGNFDNLSQGSYNILITDNLGCTLLTNPIVINEPLVFLVNYLVNEPTCFGYSNGSIDLNISGGTLPYYDAVWNNLEISSNIGGLSVGNYSLTIFDANNCQYDELILISQPNQPFVGVENSTSICLGKSHIINATSINTVEPSSINWSNSVDANIYSNNSIVTPQVTTIYTANLLDANGCQSSNIFILTINPLPDMNFISDGSTGCNPICIKFDIVNPTNSEYIWNFGDNIVSNSNSTKHCYRDSGTYDISIFGSTIFGCKDSLVNIDFIRVNKTPIASFSIFPSRSETIENPYFEFDNLSSLSDEYYWYLDTVLFSTNLNISNRYNSIGRYCIKLISIKNYELGVRLCSDTVVQCVEVTPVSVLWVPNTFTPNGDGKNDVFLVESTGIRDFEIQIFNRWGEQVYRSFDLYNGWFGDYGNKIAIDGIYNYVIYYKDAESRLHIKIGEVLLLR